MKNLILSLIVLFFSSCSNDNAPAQKCGCSDELFDKYENEEGTIHYFHSTNNKKSIWIYDQDVPFSYLRVCNTDFVGQYNIPAESKVKYSGYIYRYCPEEGEDGIHYPESAIMMVTSVEILE